MIWYSRSLFPQDLNLAQKLPRPLSHDFPLSVPLDSKLMVILSITQVRRDRLEMKNCSRAAISKK